ncbi:hypothetical protein EB093_09345 [bacterium]|nr:hypothetical protein [bacterium]
MIFGAPRTEANQPGRGSFYQSHTTFNIIDLSRTSDKIITEQFFCSFLVLNPYRDKFLLFNIILQGAGFCNQFPGFTYLS